MVLLSEVFGISAHVDSQSYVDRGGLDATFTRALNADKHVAVHGGSKQGKSWLRTKRLPDSSSLLVQCTPASSAASLLQEALGRLGVNATLTMSKTRDIGGTLDFSAAAELGKILAKLKVDGSLGGSVSTSTTTELAPIGRTAADLLWVSTTIAASKKRLVLEDFHYLSEDVQRELAFLFKAMGEYGLFVVVVVVGVWPQDHMLSYFNGDLDGRIEDIKLTWADIELASVLSQGATALNIEFDKILSDEIVREASGSVGLLQRLAEQVCIAESIFATVPGRRRHVAAGASYLLARSAVAAQMQGRFQTFADNFVRGMRRLPEGLEVYRHLLQASTDATDPELTDGLDSAILLQRILVQSGGEAIRASDLTQALDRIDKLQVKIGVNPLVLTYSRPNRSLFLADRSFLFFRRHGASNWPWSEGEPEIFNDLYVSQPLDMDFGPEAAPTS
ncbi:hypothetical protein [Cryobacterium sp. Y50]|uniref:hypothetical protein n=1 Tax=Cryobacterium sp. Y50 TaxID=2048286 RepID=UPI000CE36E70|nr:hypothetical protein [Cryobacterium sp. Y50]